MFVLFDMVVHKPSHPETEINLALLDTVVGYFGRFDYATAGSIPCGLFSGFSHIANQFVRDQWQSAAPPAEESEIQNKAQGSQGIDFASRRTYFAGPFALFSLIGDTFLNTALTPRWPIISRRCSKYRKFVLAGVSTWNRAALILIAGGRFST